MNSLTRICQALTPGVRHGRSRPSRSNQAINSPGRTLTACPPRRQATMSAMPNTSPVTAWKALKEGSERCADSRFAAEIIFDQGLGDMFVVRTAGHVMDSAVLGSVEYAVTVLNVPLIVV